MEVLPGVWYLRSELFVKSAVPVSRGRRLEIEKTVQE